MVVRFGVWGWIFLCGRISALTVSSLGLLGFLHSKFRAQGLVCRVEGLHSRVEGVEFRGLGFRVENGKESREDGTAHSALSLFGFGFRVSRCGFRVRGSGFGVSGSRSRVKGSRSRVKGSRLRVSGSGVTLPSLGVRVCVWGVEGCAGEEEDLRGLGCAPRARAPSSATAAASSLPRGFPSSHRRLPPFHGRCEILCSGLGMVQGEACPRVLQVRGKGLGLDLTFGVWGLGES